VIDRSSPASNQEVSGETSTDPRATHTRLINLYPVTIKKEVFGVGIVFVDNTDWKRPDDRQNSLHRAGVTPP
jgi:hypothetical protein